MTSRPEESVWQTDATPTPCPTLCDAYARYHGKLALMGWNMHVAKQLDETVDKIYSVVLGVDGGFVEKNSSDSSKRGGAAEYKNNAVVKPSPTSKQPKTGMEWE